MRRSLPLLPTLAALLLALPAAQGDALPRPPSALDPRPGNAAAALNYQLVYLGSTANHSLRTLPGWLGQAGGVLGHALQPPAPSLPGLLGYLNDGVRGSVDLLQASVDDGPLEVQQPVQALVVIPATILLFGQ